MRWCKLLIKVTSRDDCGHSKKKVGEAPLTNTSPTFRNDNCYFTNCLEQSWSFYYIGAI